MFQNAYGEKIIPSTFQNAYLAKPVRAHRNQEFVDVFNGFQRFKCLEYFKLTFEIKFHHKYFGK